jgi:hypothetical protein
LNIVIVSLGFHESAKAKSKTARRYRRSFAAVLISVRRSCHGFRTFLDADGLRLVLRIGSFAAGQWRAHYARRRTRGFCRA